MLCIIRTTFSVASGFCRRSCAKGILYALFLCISALPRPLSKNHKKSIFSTQKFPKNHTPFIIKELRDFINLYFFQFLNDCII